MSKVLFTNTNNDIAMISMSELFNMTFADAVETSPSLVNDLFTALYTEEYGFSIANAIIPSIEGADDLTLAELIRESYINDDNSFNVLESTYIIINNETVANDTTVQNLLRTIISITNGPEFARYVDLDMYIKEKWLTPIASLTKLSNSISKNWLPLFDALGIYQNMYDSKRALVDELCPISIATIDHAKVYDNPNNYHIVLKITDVEDSEDSKESNESKESNGVHAASLISILEHLKTRLDREFENMEKAEQAKCEESKAEELKPCKDVEDKSDDTTTKVDTDFESKA